jgi:ArsR family transcriptional regulator
MKAMDVIRALAALSHETRLAVFRALVRAASCRPGEGGLPAGVLAERLGVAPATLSFHLKEMAAARLVRPRREGRSIIYEADFATMRAVTGYLTAECCSAPDAIPAAEPSVEGRLP